MIEYLGIVYELAKDLKSHLKWDEKSKTVNNNWLDKSGLQDSAEKEKIILRWCNSDRIEEYKLKQYDIYYEIDEKKHVRFKLKNKSGQILMGKKKNNIKI